MSETEGLERGYRRLLAWYPAWHRHAHGEEMVGVLMAAAPGGKRRPGLAEAINVVWAGLLIRLRPRTAALPGGDWRDALAAFSVAAPIALTAQLLAGGLAGTVISGTGGLGAAGTLLAPGDSLGSVAIAAVMSAYYGLGLALPLVLLRLRRVAALISALGTLYFALTCAQELRFDLLYGTRAGYLDTFSLFAYAAETAALLGSSGPRRGLQILTWRAWALTLAAAAAAGVAWFAYSFSASRLVAGYPHLAAVLAAGAVAVAALAVIVGGVTARSVLGRRVLLLFAVVLYGLLTTLPWLDFMSPAARAPVTYLPLLATAGLGLRAARRSRRSGRDGSQPA
jgi:hypothetical protein